MPCCPVSFAGSCEPPDEAREQRVNRAGVVDSAPRRFFLAGPRGQRDVQRRSRFTIFTASDGVHVIRAPRHSGLLSPLVHAIPVQLLAYHTALRRGTDVDKPRNLAKAVTVE